jgi:SAM-dependent methyltransferase
VSDDLRLDRLEEALRQRAPLLWNDVARPPEAPLPPAGDLLALEAPDAGGQLEVIERELAYLASVYPHAGALPGLGTATLRERILVDRIPLPTEADREGYFSGRPLAYWLSGLADRLLVEGVAAERGRPLAPGQRLLDLGCASGRAHRHYADLAPGVELLGADIGSHHVAWARLHLPVATVALTTSVPALPLADASVDVVTAFSVLTHVDAFEEALLLELARVLRPGGFALVTFHPVRVWDDLRASGHFLRELILGARHRLDPPGTEPVTAETLAGPCPGGRVVFTNVERPVYNANVLHAEAWVRARWGRILEVERVIPRAHGDHQDAAILARR